MDTDPPSRSHQAPPGADDAALYDGLNDPTAVQQPPPRPAGGRYVQPPPVAAAPYAPYQGQYQAPYPGPGYYPEPYPPDEDDDKEPSGQAAKLWILRLSKGVVFFVYLVVAGAVALLTIAFLLQLFGANPDTGFTQWIYEHTARVMAPFRGLFEPHQVNDKSVLDFSILFAMILYAMVAIALHALATWLAEKVVVANKNIAWHERQEALRRRDLENRRLRAEAEARAAHQAPRPPASPQARPPGY
jgi:uncharacterized protein YggT (Ycf19 family)